MSRTGVECRVMVDGKQLDDGCIDWSRPPANTVGPGIFAAEGLSITWGRDTTVDQPQASTCTFTAIDDPTGVTGLSVFRLGSKIDVFADAVISGGGTNPMPTFEDPSFNVEVRATTSNYNAVRNPSSNRAVLTRPDATRQGIVKLPPGTLQQTGTNPLAWIGLASTSGGETWTISARMLIPEGLTVTMKPVLYSGPYANAATTLKDSVTRGGTGGAYLSMTLKFVPGADASWVGFQFETTGGIQWGQATGTWGSATGTWATLEDIQIAEVAVTAPAGGSSTTALVFSGRVTDMEGVYDPEWDYPALQITATDFVGELGNRYIGDEPWPVDPVTTRISRIVSKAATTEEVQVQIAPSVANINIAPDDVDNRAAIGLLTDVAQSVDGVLWSATHPVIGPYLRIEDPAERLALYQLALVNGLISIVTATYTGDNAPPQLSACDILRDPVTFTRDVADIATRATVSWQEQTTDEQGEPTLTERNVSAVDGPAEIESGTRSVQVSTQLVSAADAQRVADQLIARLAASWRVTGLAIADADIDVPDAKAAISFMTLLNGVTRGGQPLMLVDLPEWAPTGVTAPIYLEGGTYSYNGGWTLDLNVSRAAGIGRNVEWDEIPSGIAWSWDKWNPAITWDDLRGVAAPTV